MDRARFVASPESTKEDWQKARVVQASSDDTVLTKAYDLARGSTFPMDVYERVLRNDFTAEWHGRDEEVVARREELGERGLMPTATAAIAC